MSTTAADAETWSAERIAALAAAFDAAAVPSAEWTHRAHVTVAVHHLHAYGFREGSERVREGILRLNAANGVPQTPTRGYHETITRVYLRVLGDFVARAPAADVATLANAAWRELGDPALPLRWYSKERLMSWEARTGWVEPDLAELPSAVASPSP